MDAIISTCFQGKDASARAGPSDNGTRRSAFLNGADSFITKRDIATRLLVAVKDMIQA